MAVHTYNPSIREDRGRRIAKSLRLPSEFLAQCRAMNDSTKPKIKNWKKKVTNIISEAYAYPYIFRSEVTGGKQNNHQVIINTNKGLNHPLPHFCLGISHAHIFGKFLTSSSHSQVFPERCLPHLYHGTYLTWAGPVPHIIVDLWLQPYTFISLGSWGTESSGLCTAWSHLWSSYIIWDQGWDADIAVWLLEASWMLPKSSQGWKPQLVDI